MYVCDCTIRGLYPLGIPAVADCPEQNLESYMISDLHYLPPLDKRDHALVLTV